MDLIIGDRLTVIIGCGPAQVYLTVALGGRQVGDGIRRLKRLADYIGIRRITIGIGGNDLE